MKGGGPRTPHCERWRELFSAERNSRRRGGVGSGGLLGLPSLASIVLLPRRIFELPHSA